MHKWAEEILAIFVRIFQEYDNLEHNHYQPFEENVLENEMIIIKEFVCLALPKDEVTKKFELVHLWFSLA